MQDSFWVPHTHQKFHTTIARNLPDSVRTSARSCYMFDAINDGFKPLQHVSCPLPEVLSVIHISTHTNNQAYIYSHVIHPHFSCLVHPAPDMALSHSDLHYICTGGLGSKHQLVRFLLKDKTLMPHEWITLLPVGNCSSFDDTQFLVREVSTATVIQLSNSTTRRYWVGMHSFDDLQKVRTDAWSRFQLHKIYTLQTLKGYWGSSSGDFCAVKAHNPRFEVL